MRYLWLLMVVGLLGGWHWWTYDRPVTRGSGVVVAGEPEQRALDAPRQWNSRGYTFIARARYDITSRILRRENYHVDGGANIAPLDLAVGWGPMSDSAVLSKLSITQGNRFYFWTTPEFPIPRRDTEIHSANMHLIPATDAIERRIEAARVGQVVKLSGYLVDVRGDDGWSISTSMTREDTGAGACEVIWVEEFE